MEATNSSFVPGSASLLNLLDKPILLTMRDGSHLFGILRSYDQFANLLLAETVQRVYNLPNYAQQHKEGLFLVRGENVVLLAEIDEDELDVYLSSLIKVDSLSVPDRDTSRADCVLKNLGFSVDFDVNDHY